MARTFIALFNSSEDAERTVERLQELGIPKEEVSVLAKGTRQNYKREIKHDVEVFHENGDFTGAAAGGAIGGFLGGAVGFLAGAVILALPGLTPILGIGPLLTAFGGAGIGALAGGAIGALTDLGVSEEAAEAYFEDIEAGKIFLSLQLTDNDLEQVVRRTLAEGGAVTVNDHQPVHTPEPTRKADEEPASLRS